MHVVFKVPKVLFLYFSPGFGTGVEMYYDKVNDKFRIASDGITGSNVSSADIGLDLPLSS